MKISINTNKLNRAIDAAFKDTALIMAGEFTKAITDSVYPWPRGESPRDAVETGRLRASQSSTVAGDTATYAWATDYALAVHNGAVLRNGTILPARRWTSRAIESRDPIVVYQTILPRYL